MELINKLDNNDLPPPAPYEERPISRARWRKHRGSMLATSFAGHRPVEWWIYERNMSPPDSEEIWLFDNGELSGAELAELMADWRKQFEHANEPGFAYCIGHAKPQDTFATWIGGVAARKAHYRWAEIPVMLIRQWGRERHHLLMASPDGGP